MSSASADARNSEPLVVKRRLTGPVLPGHVAEARRRLGSSEDEVSDERLTRALWVARALPAALDVLADTRSAPGLAGAQLTSAWVHADVCGAGPLVALGVLPKEGDALQVRFVRADDERARSVALVVWQLSAKVADDGGTPIIHRFVHGPRR